MDQSIYSEFSAMYVQGLVRFFTTTHGLFLILAIFLILVFALYLAKWIFRVNEIVEALKAIARANIDKNEINFLKKSKSDFRKKTIEQNIN